VKVDRLLDKELSRENWIRRLCMIYQINFEHDEIFCNAGIEAASKAHTLLQHGNEEYTEVLELLG
jgi:hypothetical protein